MSRRALACVLAMSTSCSWIAMDTLPADYRGKTEPKCSAGAGPAVIDSIFAVLDGIEAVNVYSDRDPSTTLYAAAFGLLWAASAASGFSDASACQDAQRKWDQRQQRRERQEEERDREDRERHDRDHEELQRLRREVERRKEAEEEQPIDPTERAPVDAGVADATVSD